MDVVKHSSPRAEQLINEQSLGQKQVEYSENRLKRALLCFAFLPVGLCMLALTLPTLLSPVLTDVSWWGQVGNMSYLLVSGSCFSLLGVTGVIMLVITLWKGEKRLYLGEKGFVLTQRRLETVVRWDAVAEIHKHILFLKSKSEKVQQVKSICSYTIVSTDGKKCSFTDEPGPRVEDAVTAYQFPRLLETYARGKRLSFGWLALDSKGLHLTPEGGSTSNPTMLAKFPGVARTSQKLRGISVESGESFLPWEHLTCAWIDESRSTLIVSKRDERKHWAIVPLYQIVNPTLCLALIEHVCSGDTQETTSFSGAKKSMPRQSVFAETALYAEDQLGPLVATYQTQATRAGKRAFWGIGLLSLLLVGGLVALDVWLIVPTINDPFFSLLFFVFMIGIPIVVFGLMLAFLWWTFRVHMSLATPIRRKIVVSQYERGLVYREGRKVQTTTWAQIDFVERLALPRKHLPRRYYKLTLKDATEMTLPVVIAQIQELGAAIESEMLKRLLPGVLADYDAQKPITFSGFCLNHDSVSQSDERLPWSQVEQVRLANEMLTIKEKGVAKDWFCIPAAQVHTMCMLEALLASIQEMQGFRMDEGISMKSEQVAARSW